jgi:DNA-binding transcriptional ArsR family regulator
MPSLCPRCFQRVRTDARVSFEHFRNESADECLTCKARLAYGFRQGITCVFQMAERHDTDLLFKALADPSRRKLLDLLHAHDGRTLNELCEHLDMTRQGVTQHLDLLEAANLVASVRRGREKLHFLNPVPLQEIYERWIAKFERPRLKALSNLKKQLEKADG